MSAVRQASAVACCFVARCPCHLPVSRSPSGPRDGRKIPPARGLSRRSRELGFDNERGSNYVLVLDDPDARVANHSGENEATAIMLGCDGITARLAS